MYLSILGVNYAERIMAKRQASLFGFCQNTQRDKGSMRRRLMIKTKNQMTYRQDVQVEDSPEESEHSCHDPSHMMSTLSPQIFSDLLATEVVNH